MSRKTIDEKLSALDAKKSAMKAKFKADKQNLDKERRTLLKRRNKEKRELEQKRLAKLGALLERKIGKVNVEDFSADCAVRLWQNGMSFKNNFLQKLSEEAGKNWLDEAEYRELQEKAEKMPLVGWLRMRDKGLSYEEQKGEVRQNVPSKP